MLNIDFNEKCQNDNNGSKSDFGNVEDICKKKQKLNYVKNNFIP